MSHLSEDHKPFTLITGPPTHTHEQINELVNGDYVHLHTTKDVINTVNTRIIPAIALFLSLNLQNGWKFMSLHTGSVIDRKQWKKVPMTPKVIKQVNGMGKNEGRPLVTDNFKNHWKYEEG